MAGLSKLAGSKMQIETFKHLGLPQWFRIITGLVQLAAVAAMVGGYWNPGWAAAAGLLLGIVAIGGLLAHIRAKDSFKQTFPIVLLGILSFAVFLYRLSDLQNVY
jgi:peptidoglycan/LPS O-acetylase OafA/YrhL